MGEVDLDVAGRRYRIACAEGQEPALRAAGARIAAEAEALREASGDRFSLLSEARVLLMAGLKLADRMAEAPKAAEDPARGGLFEDPAQSARIAELEAALAEARAAEAAALAEVEAAAARIRALAADLREGLAETETETETETGDAPDADPNAPDEDPETPPAA